MLFATQTHPWRLRSHQVNYSLEITRTFPGRVQTSSSWGPCFGLPSAYSEWLTGTRHLYPKEQFPLCEFCCIWLYKADYSTHGESLVEQKIMESGNPHLAREDLKSRFRTGFGASPILCLCPNAISLGFQTGQPGQEGGICRCDPSLFTS